MFNKIKQAIGKFISEVVSDIKKFNFSKIFSDYKLLAIFIAVFLATIIVCINMKFFAVVKGVLFMLVFYFIFFWKNKGDNN